MTENCDLVPGRQLLFSLCSSIKTMEKNQTHSVLMNDVSKVDFLTLNKCHARPTGQLLFAAGLWCKLWAAPLKGPRETGRAQCKLPG